MSTGHKSRIRSVSHASKSVVSAGSNARQRIVAEGRRERRAAETRVRIFRCALELIASRGLSNVTVEDITEAADVGKGTFFNYFASKDHVLGVMAEIQLGKIREALAQRKKRTTRFVLHELMHESGKGAWAKSSSRQGPHFVISWQPECSGYLETKYARRQ